MIIINLKNYVSGQQALDLVKKIEIYYGKAIVAVSALDISFLSKNTTLQLYAQHVDFHDSGHTTGYTIPEHLIAHGALGSLLNHSEHPISFEIIKKTVQRANQVGLKLVICAGSLTEAKKIISLNPYAIAFEDKKLISTGKSITSYKTAELQKFVSLFKDSDSIPLCGAGITTGEDVAKALTLGCKGVLVSSAVANSTTPEKFLKEISGLL